MDSFCTHFPQPFILSTLVVVACRAVITSWLSRMWWFCSTSPRRVLVVSWEIKVLGHTPCVGRRETHGVHSVELDSILRNRFRHSSAKWHRLERTLFIRSKFSLCSSIPWPQRKDCTIHAYLTRYPLKPTPNQIGFWVITFALLCSYLHPARIDILLRMQLALGIHTCFFSLYRSCPRDTGYSNSRVEELNSFHDVGDGVVEESSAQTGGLAVWPTKRALAIDSGGEQRNLCIAFVLSGLSYYPNQ